MLELRASDLVPVSGRRREVFQSADKISLSSIPVSRPASASSIPVSRLRQAEGRKCTALLRSVAAAGGAARCRRRKAVLTKLRRSRPEGMEEK